MKKLSFILLSFFYTTIYAQDQFEIRAFTTAALGSDLAVGDADFAGGDRGFKTGIGLNGGLDFLLWMASVSTWESISTSDLQETN